MSGSASRVATRQTQALRKQAAQTQPGKGRCGVRASEERRGFVRGRPDGGFRQPPHSKIISRFTDASGQARQEAVPAATRATARKGGDFGRWGKARKRGAKKGQGGAARRVGGEAEDPQAR
jgi:hypothetical protein